MERKPARKREKTSDNRRKDNTERRDRSHSALELSRLQSKYRLGELLGPYLSSVVEISVKVDVCISTLTFSRGLFPRRERDVTAFFCHC